MAALTATALPALGIVKLVLNWAPYRNEVVSIQRVEPDGNRVDVLGTPVTLSGSDAIVYDTTPPLDVNLFYRATLVNPMVLRDGFDRTTSGGWGTPEFATVAGTYLTAGGVSGDYSTSGGQGLHSLTSTGTQWMTLAPDTSYTDGIIEGTTWIGVTPTGSLIRTGLASRYTDQNNHYQFNVVHNTSGKITLAITKRSSGTETVIASMATDMTTGVNKQFRIVASSIGTTHRMEVWDRRGQGTKSVLVANDATFTSGRFTTRSQLNIGNTNTLPVVVRYDNLKITQVTTLTLTSGIVAVTAAPHGWMRDPLVPGNSIRLDNCADHTFDCLNSNQMVFFQGFGDEDYRSTSGVFEVNNAERPVVVAQVRKDLTTTLRFASVTLADVTRVRTLFRSGRNLALSLPPAYGWGLDSYGTDMFTAGDLTAGRLNPRDMRKPYRLWSTEIAAAELDDTLPHGTVGGNGIPIPGATFGDMKATGKTFGQLKATGRTFLDFAQGVYS